MPSALMVKEKSKSKRILIREKDELLREIEEVIKEKDELVEVNNKLQEEKKEILENKKELVLYLGELSELIEKERGTLDVEAIKIKEIENLIEKSTKIIESKSISTENEIYLSTSNFIFLLRNTLPFIFVFAGILFISSFSTMSESARIMGALGAIVLGAIALLFALYRKTPRTRNRKFIEK